MIRIAATLLSLLVFVFCYIFSSSGTAVADDACGDSTAQMRQFVLSLPPLPTPDLSQGQFKTQDVEELFKISYLVDRKTIFQRDYAKPTDSSLEITPLRPGGYTALLFNFAPGRRIQCSYIVFPSPRESRFGFKQIGEAVKVRDLNADGETEIIVSERQSWAFEKCDVSMADVPDWDRVFHFSPQTGELTDVSKRFPEFYASRVNEYTELYREITSRLRLSDQCHTKFRQLIRHAEEIAAGVETQPAAPVLTGPGGGYPRPYSYYVKKYGFDAQAEAARQQTLPSRVQAAYQYFVKEVAPRLPPSLDAQLVLWWAYIEGILRKPGAPWSFSNCMDRNFEPAFDCTGMWQVGYGVQVNDHLKDLAEAVRTMHPGKSAKEIGETVLKHMGGSLTFPEVEVSGLVTNPAGSTMGKTNRYWASVLMRDPLISAFLESRTLMTWPCYQSNRPGWCEPYVRKRSEHSAMMARVIANWPSSGTPTPPSRAITGVLREVVESGELYVVPLVGYEGQTYWSAYVEGYNEDRAKADIARQRLAGVQDFWLYVKGSLVGNFRATGLKDFSEEGGPQNAFAGNVHWHSKPHTDADRYHIIINAVALSRPIPQPFWPTGLHLSAQQVSSLEDILHETLLRAPSLLAKEAKQKLNYKSFKHSIATAPKTSSVEVMDLDQDGQPEVYATVSIVATLEGKGCAVQATLLATWVGNWRVLKRSTYMSECPGFLTAGDDHFTVSVVDLEGTRVAQLILSEGRWESWSRTLYQMRNGQLIKKLDIGDYGS